MYWLILLNLNLKKNVLLTYSDYVNLGEIRFSEENGY